MTDPLACYCSEYMSSGLPCPPSKCPNVPKPTELEALANSWWAESVRGGTIIEHAGIWQKCAFQLREAIAAQTLSRCTHVRLSDSSPCHSTSRHAPTAAVRAPEARDTFDSADVLRAELSRTALNKHCERNV